MSYHASFASRSINKKPRQQPQEKELQEAILISRNSGGIGDLLMLTPTLRQIRKENPNKQIILCTTENYQRGVLFDVVRHNPDIDKVVPTTELQNYRFTKVYNFNTAREVAMETNFHPTGNRIDIFAELANLELDDKQTVYVVTPAEKEWAKDWIKKNINTKRRRLIGIQVSATTMRRTWPAEKQGLLAFRIIGKYPDTTILFFSEGTPAETEVYPNFIPIGGMPLRWTAALINECELMVVPDSGLMHLAGALKKRMIALFGPNPPRTRILYYPNAVGIWIAYPCAQNCWYERCLAGDTKISLLNGTEVPIENLVGKENFWVYSCKENGEVVPGKVKKVWKTGTKSVVKLTLDSGESFKCTEDHLLMLRDGNYKEAKDCINESLMPLYRRKSRTGYELIKSNLDDNYHYTYLLVDEYFNGKKLNKEQVHHKDLNKNNNYPTNFERKSKEDHIKLHANLNGTNHYKYRKDITFELIEKSILEDNLGLYELANKLRCGPFVIDSRIEKKIGGNYKELRFKLTGYNYTNPMKDPIIVKKAKEGWDKKRKIKYLKKCELYESFKLFILIVLVIKYYKLKERRIKASERMKLSNPMKNKGTVEKVINKRKKLYNENPEREKKSKCLEYNYLPYFCGCGCMGICNRGKRYISGHNAKGKEIQSNPWKIKNRVPWNLGLTKETSEKLVEIGKKISISKRHVNHKVVSIEQGVVEEVFDLQVDKYHNFALTSGVFVHNCFNSFRCMSEIPVEMVWERVEKLLRGDIIDQNLILKDAGTLVLRMGGIGDLIMLSSSLKAYEEVHPDEKLIFATSPQHMDVLKDAPFLDKIIPIPDSYKSSFYKVIDLRYKLESPEVGGILDSEIYKTVNRSDVFDRLMGIENAKKDFYVNVDEEKVKEVKKAIGYSKKYRYIGIQVTCTSNTRTIPPEYVPEIVKQFRTVKDLKIVVFGNEEFWHGRRMGKENFEKEKIGKVRTVNLMGETNQAEMIALCSIMDYIISPDSAAVHIAGALGKKCLGLFGNMDPYLRIYYYPTVKALYPKNELPCVPCYDWINPCEYYKKLSTPNQPIGGECMRKLTPERIFQEAKEWFEI